MYIGKETIELTDQFLELDYVKHEFNQKVAPADPNKSFLIENLKEELKLQVLPSCHGEHVSKLPPDATLGGSSKRTPNEIWTIGNRVLCI
jgi:GMP synthase-like glutamine amidotransferase